MKTPLRLVVLFVALLGFATASHAAPITYTISGTASGQLGSLSFTDALVTVTATADTDNVVANDVGDVNNDGISDTLYANPTGTTVNIAGLGTVNVLDATAIYAFPPIANPDPGEELFLQPVVVIGTLDSPPSLDSFTGIAAIGADSLLGYNLATSIGPIVSTGGIGHPPYPINTSGGSLFFASNDIGGGTATFTATTTVPEPGSLPLLACGVLSLAGLGRFRKRA